MKETREHIIGLADGLIRSKGFNAFSYSNIAGIMDVRNAAIHYHFPAKSDLGIAVIDKELEEMAHFKRDWDNLRGDEQLKRLMQRFYGGCEKGVICLTGAFTSGYATFPFPLQKRVQEMCRAILDWMTDCLEKGKAEGSLQFQGDAYDRALLVMSSLLSSLLLSRVLGQGTFDRMMTQQLKDLGSSPRIWTPGRIWLDDLDKDE